MERITNLSETMVPAQLRNDVRENAIIPAGGRWLQLCLPHGDGERILYAYTWQSGRFSLWDDRGAALGLYAFYEIQPQVAALLAQEETHDRR